MSATDQLIEKLNKAIAIGEFKDAREGAPIIQKREPQLYQQSLIERGLSKAQPTPTRIPLDYNQRMAKQQEASLSASEVIARRIEAEIVASGTTQDKALSKIIHDDPQLWQRYRAEQYQGGHR